MAQGVGIAELAYLGDAVFELLVRDMLLNEGVPFRDMSRRAKDYVSAVAQSAMYHHIFDALSEVEQAMMKRGRNLHGASRAKSANVSEYRHATGLEVLFGYLHHQGELARLQEIFTLCIRRGELCSPA
ncbi:MAG: ribonuclease III [Defluviitaleaceae bacterium]|nr:ribonuclease III [Defluviitaleaceae bacterium]